MEQAEFNAVCELLDRECIGWRERGGATPLIGKVLTEIGSLIHDRTKLYELQAVVDNLT